MLLHVRNFINEVGIERPTRKPLVVRMANGVYCEGESIVKNETASVSFQKTTSKTIKSKRTSKMPCSMFLLVDS